MSGFLDNEPAASTTLRILRQVNIARTFNVQGLQNEYRYKLLHNIISVQTILRLYYQHLNYLSPKSSTSSKQEIVLMGSGIVFVCRRPVNQYSFHNTDVGNACLPITQLLTYSSFEDFKADVMVMLRFLNSIFSHHHPIKEIRTGYGN